MIVYYNKLITNRSITYSFIIININYSLTIIQTQYKIAIFFREVDTTVTHIS